MNVNSRSAALLGLLTALSGGIVGCSYDENASTSDSPPVPVVQFALTTSNLPPCLKGNDGAIWYVWSASQFYVCKGSTRTWTQTNINGYNAAVSMVPLSAGTACPAGGVTIKFGLDTNRNGTLDPSEVTSTANLCNGATGATGPARCHGRTGTAGRDGCNWRNWTARVHGSDRIHWPAGCQRSDRTARGAGSYRSPRGIQSQLPGVTHTRASGFELRQRRRKDRNRP